MPYISIIRVNDTDYTIKDSEQESRLQDLLDRLGNLAFKDTASGNMTPSGTVSTPTITVQTSSKTIKAVNNPGIAPTWSANVTGETLSFSWSPGSVTTTTNEPIITQITGASSSTPVFTGKEGSVTVS